MHLYSYVYRITCTHPDSIEKYYYGSRSCDCDPYKDNSYWSSSKYIKHARTKFGTSFFKKKIIKIFSNQVEALQYEIMLHEKLNVSKHPLFFNKSKQTIWGIHCTGTVNKGKTYEEIYGIEKASALRLLRAEKTKGKNNKGTHNPMYGKKHTIESIQTMRECKQGRLHPTFNWFWITDNNNSKKVPPGSNIPEGWRKGRRIKHVVHIPEL